MATQQQKTDGSSQPGEAPLHFLVPLYPAFQLLDLAGPLDILNLLSIVPGGPAIKLTIISDTLDPVPTKPIPPRSADWTFDLSPHFKDGKVNLSFSQAIVPDTTYDDYLSALSSSDAKVTPVDVLLIPGGVGSRLDRIYCSPSKESTKTSNVQGLLDFIPKIAPHIRHSIITVCTGSFILSETGLLDGRRATTNMRRFDIVAASNPKVKWQTAARWVKSTPSEVAEGDDRPAKDLEIWTSAGISAGMDVTLAFVAEYYGGKKMARELAKMLEYDWREIGEGEKDPLYEGY